VVRLVDPSLGDHPPIEQTLKVHPHRAAVCSEQTCRQADDVVGERHAQQQHGAYPSSLFQASLLPG
jgi:hypothetical protein